MTQPMIKIINEKSVSLVEALLILKPFLDDEDTTEIVINKPFEVITETNKGWQYHKVEELTFIRCFNIAKLTATYSGQSLDKRLPIISATLPAGERVQIAIPPVTLSERISITIRRASDCRFSLEDYKKSGMFDNVEETTSKLNQDELKLLDFLKEKNYTEFLRLAISARKTIVVSGNTGSGKTTLCKTLLDLVPKDERLISIENVDELQLYESHPNTVNLFYSAGSQGISKTSQQELLESCLRMKPDRIFVAELIRGDEAFYYLRNVNSGHPGSITTIHANSTKLAFEQLVLFLKESEAGSSLSRKDIKQFLFMCVDIVIQIKKVGTVRKITGIYFDPQLKLKQLEN